MASLIKVTGVKQVQQRLKAAALAQGAKAAANAYRAGLYVQRESQKIVPIDTGNLRNTAFTRNIGGAGWLHDVIVGYTANYAVYVHEDPNARHAEGKTYKFLEKILKDSHHRRNILAIMAGKKI